MGLSFDDIGEGLGTYYGYTMGGIFGSGAGGDWGDGIQNPDENSAGTLYDIFDPLDFSGKKAKNAAYGQAAKQEAERKRWKALQYDMLGKKQAPTLSPQQEARIKALESESQLKLHEDPAFQTQMRMATGGGAQALSSIQNKQAASGATGGFANQGSMADVYDRLGTQLAGLAQNQTQYKERKRDLAAEARQNFADAKIAFENAQIDAKMAIESGDHAAVSDAMNRLYAAQAQADAAMKQNALAAAQIVVGAYTGNGMGVANGTQALAGGQQQQSQAYQGMGQSPTVGQSAGMYQQNPFGTQQQQGYTPYYQMGKR